MAPSRSATAMTWSAGTKRNVGSLSMNRAISHGQAMRSTRAFSRVTHFMSNLPSSTSLAAAFRATNGELVKRGHRIGLGPQPYVPGLEPRIAMVQVQLAVEPPLHVVAHGHEAHSVPLAERGSFHGRRRELPSASIVGIEAEVVLERVRAHDVVLPIGEPEHDAARG